MRTCVCYTAAGHEAASGGCSDGEVSVSVIRTKGKLERE